MVADTEFMPAPCVPRCGGGAPAGEPPLTVADAPSTPMPAPPFGGDAGAVLAAGDLLGDSDRAERPAHFPDHLPPLPGKHSYVKTEVGALPHSTDSARMTCTN